MPNVNIFVIGTWSMMVAAIMLPAITGEPFGMTTRELGATPKLHMIVAPITTS
jgi:hypothetical protein